VNFEKNTKERIVDFYRGWEKVKVFRNATNMDCHRNKAAAVRRATLPWVILFDSDNVLTRRYLDTLFAISVWDSHVVYCPSFAQPYFDYRAFEGEVFDRHNLGLRAINPTFLTALNTCNYFVHRDDYLAVWDGSVDPHTADSIYQNYRWLASGRRLLITPGLHYFHRVHDQSHYKQNVHKTGGFAREVEIKLRNLR